LAPDHRALHSSVNMIPKSVQRFSEKLTANKKLEQDDDSWKVIPL
jgi:hypothetical protein